VARLLCCSFAALVDEVINQGDHPGTANDISKCNWQQIGAKTDPRKTLHASEGNSILEQNSQRHEVHVGNTMLKAGRHESRNWKHNGENFIHHTTAGDSKGKRALATPIVSTFSAISAGEYASKPKISAIKFSSLAAVMAVRIR
jgi:hypothetical protein